MQKLRTILIKQLDFNNLSKLILPQGVKKTVTKWISLLMKLKCIIREMSLKDGCFVDSCLKETGT